MPGGRSKEPAAGVRGLRPIDIFVSEDQCKTWERLDSVWDVPFVETVTYPVAVVEPHVRDISIDPNDPNTIYAALQVGYILKSTDAGKTWKLLNQNLDCDVHTIVINPSNPNNILVATGGHDSRSGRAPGRALYGSEDGGETWAPRAMNFSQEYSVPLAMSPSNPKVLYSSLAHGQPNSWRRPTGAESMLVRSKDGGESWEQLSRGLDGAQSGFAEAIIVDKEDPNRLFAAQRGGDIYASEDGGDSWTSVDAHVPGVASAKMARFS